MTQHIKNIIKKILILKESILVKKIIPNFFFLNKIIAINKKWELFNN